MFPRVYLLSALHTSPVSMFYQNISNSWDLHLRRNPHDREIDEISALIVHLDSVRIIGDVGDTRVWVGDGTNSFSSKSFLKHITMPTRYPPFPIANYIWKCKAPFKVRAFVWTMVLGKINTNDMLQRRRPTCCISPDICMMCRCSCEDISHLFLHCDIARSLWIQLLHIRGESWVCPSSIMAHLQTYHVGLGRDKEKKILWRCAFMATFWVIWLERNARIFTGKIYCIDFLWGRVIYLASLWAKAAGAFKGIPITILQHNWINL